MSDLEQYRKEIDEIDRELTRLVEQRFNVAKKVASYKIQQQLPVLDASREEQVIKRNQERLIQSEYESEIADFYNELMRISRNIQEKMLNE